jgi:hypothetical protein
MPIRAGVCSRALLNLGPALVQPFHPAAPDDVHSAAAPDDVHSAAAPDDVHSAAAPDDVHSAAAPDDVHSAAASFACLTSSAAFFDRSQPLDRPGYHKYLPSRSEFL